MNKTDIHVHCARQRLDLPFGNPMDPLSHYVCDPQEMLETMQANRIGHAVLMSAGETPDNGMFRLGATNADCRAICEQSGGKLHWMCNFDPVEPDTLYQRMTACKKQGAVGVGEVMLNQWLDSPFLAALFAAAEKLELPVLCHMSPEPGFSYGVCDHAGLPLLEKVLQTYPDLKFLGHSQVFWLEISGDCPREGNEARNGFGRGPVQPGGTVERLFTAYPNLYGDLSAFSAFCAITRDEAYGLAFLEKFQDRLLFATDATNRRNIPPMSHFLDKAVEESKLSRTAYEKICYTNAKKLFDIG